MQPFLVSANEVPDPQERLGLISSMISETFCSSWRAVPIGDATAHASIACSHADGVSVSHSHMSPLSLRNGRTSASKRIYSAFITSQPLVMKVEQGGSIFVPPQEFMILSSDTPCELVTNRPYTTTSLVIDADLFMEHVPNDYQALIGRRLSYPFGLKEILHATLDSCMAVSAAGHFAEAGPKLVRSFLELLSLFDLEPDKPERQRLSTGLDIRRAQVKAFIEKNFHQPEMSIATIASRLQLTPRYIQMSFEAEGLTPSEYLRECRIKACAEMLRDPKCENRSITDIAFSNGFNSSSHFSTEFKRAMGMSPRNWRQTSFALNS